MSELICEMSKLGTSPWDLSSGMMCTLTCDDGSKYNVYEDVNGEIFHCLDEKCYEVYVDKSGKHYEEIHKLLPFFYKRKFKQKEK